MLQKMEKLIINLLCNFGLSNNLYQPELIYLNNSFNELAEFVKHIYLFLFLIIIFLFLKLFLQIFTEFVLLIFHMY